MIDPLPADTSPALGSGSHRTTAVATGSLWARWRASPGGLDAGSWLSDHGPLDSRLLPLAGAWRPPAGGFGVDRLQAPESPPNDCAPGWSLRIRALYGARSPTVEALLLNRRSAMDPELRDQYARSGLVHLLSISGFHVGLIALWVVLALRLVARWWPGLPGTGATAPLVAAGIACALRRVPGLAGARPPGPRCWWPCWPWSATASARWTANRCWPPMRLLLLFFDPWSVLDLGAWLSFLSLWGASRCVAWSDRALGRALGRSACWQDR